MTICKPISIEGILRRAAQGVTRPFFCKTSDGPYWLKGRNTGMAGLCHEWIAGCMARALGLPVPSFGLIEVGREIISGSSLPDAGELGVGPAFASRHVVSDGDLSFTTALTLPLELKLRILFFDAWVRNEDRTLGGQGGNVNLLWDQAHAKLWVIDHNNAFDPGFQWDRFLANHVFSHVLSAEGLRSPELDKLRAQMKEITGKVPEFFNELPQEWLEIAETQDTFSLESIRRMISEFDPIFDNLP